LPAPAYAAAVLAVSRMRRPKKAIAPDLAAKKILADYVVGKNLIFKPPSPDLFESQKRFDSKVADSRAARTRQAKELFAAIRNELGLAEARQIFKDAQRGHRAKKNKRWPEDEALIDFALSVHASDSGSPVATARKFAADLGMSVSALEKRIQRLLRKVGRQRQGDN
jgi:hypothetical protein